MKYAYTFDDIQIIPKYSEIESRSQCELITKFTKRYVIGTPLVSSPMDTVSDSKMCLAMASHGGVGVVHRFMSIGEQSNQSRKIKEQEKLVAAAIGATGDYQERAQELINAGVIVLLIDVAHGNTKQVKDAIKWCKENLPEYVDMIAGNVSTREGARLQGLPEWFDFADQPNPLSYKQLGNGVNVGAVYNVIKAQVLRDIDLLTKKTDLIKAVLGSPASPDSNLKSHKDFHSYVPAKEIIIPEEYGQLKLIK